MRLLTTLHHTQQKSKDLCTGSKPTQAKKAIPHELNLLMTCCSAFSNKETFEQTLKKSTTNWDAFLKLVARHRVTPMTTQNLTQWQCDQVPNKLLEKLKKRNTQISAKSLMQTACMIKISQHFNQNNIAHLHFKGPSLSQYLYQKTALREYKDLDILIKQKDFDQAIKTLESIGFICQSPKFEKHPHLKNQFLSSTKDCYFTNAQGVELELHWHFMKNIKQMDAHQKEAPNFFWNHPKTLSLNGHEIKTFSGEALLLYLFFHGHLSGWFRLHWLVDILDFIKKNSPNWQTLFKLAKQYHIENALYEGFYFIELFFDIKVYRDTQNKQIERLIYNSQKLIFMKNMKLNGLWLHYRRLFLMCHGISDKTTYLTKSIATSPKDWAILPLPKYLFFLYYLLRPILILIRKHQKNKISKINIAKKKVKTPQKS